MNIKAFLLFVMMGVFFSVSAENLPPDDVLKDRVKRMNTCVEPHFDNVMKSYIETYTVKDRSKAEAILGKVVMYFPIFEKELALKGMPQSLKYLSITESALNPMAVSRSNAVGLWQFMAPTATEYGLEMNHWVDERKDPIRSTKAALNYLDRLHSKYGDWALALAAYNGGPGRVNRAIKRGRNKDYWRVRKFLPRETQHYVTAYLGAAYLMHYHQQHNLKPNYPDLDLQLIASVKVYDQIDLNKLAKIVQIPEWKLAYLNPSYIQNVVPRSFEGNYLFVPQRVLGVLTDYLERPDASQHFDQWVESIPAPSNESVNNRFEEKIHFVKSGENVYSIAKMYDISPYHLESWNGLVKNEFLREGRQLRLFIAISPSKNLKLAQMMGVYKEYETLPLKSIKPLEAKPIRLKKQMPNIARVHVVKRRELSKDIAKKYGLSSVNKLFEYNEMKPKKRLKAGTVLYIPPKK